MAARSNKTADNKFRSTKQVRWAYFRLEANGHKLTKPWTKAFAAAKKRVDESSRPSAPSGKAHAAFLDYAVKRAEAAEAWAAYDQLAYAWLEYCRANGVDPVEAAQ